jgi:transcriptional regulator with XRE-family HTH domain
MLINEIIAKASEIKGGKQKIAEEINIHPARISDWLAGRRKPEAAEIAILAEMAGMPILETIASVEEELNDKYKDIWKRAVTEWRAQRDSNPRPLPSEGSTLSI